MAPAAAESASPIGIANLPNQRHKIVAKRGAAFTIMVRVHGLPLTAHTELIRLLVNQDWARLPSSIHCSLPPSRTTPITRDGTQSRLTRLWRLRSPRQNWRRSSSKVRSIHIHQLADTDDASSVDCHRYSGLWRLCQQPRLVDAHHRIPR